MCVAPDSSAPCGPAGTLGAASNIVVRAEELTSPLPGWSAWLPNAMLLPAMFSYIHSHGRTTYQDVAAAIVEHLAVDGPFKHKRVGFGLKA